MTSKFKALRELLGQVEVLRTYYDRLTERERTIVVFSVAGGSVFLLFSMYLIVMSIASSMEKGISKNFENLTQLKTISLDYANAEKQVTKIENMIKSTGSDFQLPTTLEKLANKYSLKIESIKDRPAQPNDLYKEIQSAVSVKEVNLRTLVTFMHEIENSPQLMKINSLTIRPNFKDASLLNVDFMVSTFQLKS